MTSYHISYCFLVFLLLFVFPFRFVPMNILYTDSVVFSLLSLILVPLFFQCILLLQ